MTRLHTQLVRSLTCVVALSTSTLLHPGTGAWAEDSPMPTSSSGLGVARLLFDQVRPQLSRATARLTSEACRRSAELGRLDFLLEALARQIVRQQQRTDQMARDEVPANRLTQERQILDDLIRQQEDLREQRRDARRTHLAELQKSAASMGRQPIEVDVLLSRLRTRTGRPVASPSSVAEPAE